jgi:hypothetical protein
MSLETAVTPEAPLDERWQRAIANAPAVIKGREPKITDEKLAEEVQAVETALHDFADSKTLKLVTYATEDGKENRSIEPDWSETDGFGLPVDLYAGVMGLDTPHIFQHGDATSEELLGSLADASQKPVSAMVNGQYIPPVAPQTPELAA